MCAGSQPSPTTALNLRSTVWVTRQSVAPRAVQDKELRMFRRNRIALVALLTTVASATANAAEEKEKTSALDELSLEEFQPVFQALIEEDKGYQAINTLAGTRLRSNLKNLSASISVITKDFMNDIGAADLNDLLVYTLGTEVAGSGGNFSGLSAPEAGGIYDDALGQAIPATRIRGLTSADLTRNHFLSDIPLDTYNLERVEISRGPNAMLFGLGSPSGIVNSSLIQATLNGTKTSAATRLGSYGSRRVTLDHNQVIFAGKLSARLAGVYDDTQFRIEDAFGEKKAATLSLTYKPWRQTALRATAEVGSENSNRPEERPPFDRFTWWWAAGKPVWNPTTHSGRLLGTPQAPWTTTGATAAFLTAGGSRNTRLLAPGLANSPNDMPALFYLDPNSSAIGGLDIGGGVTVDGVEAWSTSGILPPGGSALVNGGMVWFRDPTFILQDVYQATNPTRALFTRNPQITDPAIFDFYHQMLGGPTKYEWADWKTLNLTFEQTFLDRKTGIELAYDKQTLDNGFTSPLSYQLALDINEVLPNGAPNPNFLRPMSAGLNWKRVYRKEREALRATAYYDLDLAEYGSGRLMKALGRHLFNATYSWQEPFAQERSGKMWATGSDYRLAERLPVPGSVGAAPRSVATVQYLGGSVLNAATPQDAVIQGVTANHDPSHLAQMTLLHNARPTSTAPAALTPWGAQMFGLISNSEEGIENTNSLATRTEQLVRSTSAALQSQWLSGTLATTVGWRKDSVSSYDAGLPSEDPATGVLTTTSDAWPLERIVGVAEETVSWGVVGHAPPRLREYLPYGHELSVFYHNSRNFRVVPQRYNIRNESIGPETGDSQEYGLRIGTVSGRVALRLSHYKTIADKASVGGLTPTINILADLVESTYAQISSGANAGNPAGIAAFDAWLESPYGQDYLDAFNYILDPNTDPAKPVAQFGKFANVNGERAPVAGTSTFESQGYELEMILNPTANWRITANAAKADALRTRVAAELDDFINNPESGILALVQAPDLSSTTAGALRFSPTADVYSTVRNNVVGPSYAIFQLNGAQTDELRKYRANLLTDYSFGAKLFGGRLAGLNIGGALRWQDKVLIGYEATTAVNSAGTTVPIFDFSKPIHGPTETNVDLWLGYSREWREWADFHVQLNIKNVGVGNELIPIYANPDGTPAMWRIREPQRWALNFGLEF
jgi:outer membrane receptor protein involved in Fe transport